MVTKDRPGVEVNPSRLNTQEYKLYTGYTDEEIIERLDAQEPQGFPSFLLGGSSITYDTGRGKFNYCEHLQEVPTCYVDPQPYVTMKKIWSTSGRGYWIYYYIFHKFAICMPSDHPPAWPAPIESIDDGLRARAWADLQPKLNDGFSMANFLFELRDFSLIFGTVRQLVRKIQLLTHDAGHLFSSKTAAELLLTYSFGIAPLKDDLQNLVQKLFDTQRIINEFIEDGKKVRSYHYREELWQSTKLLRDEEVDKVTSITSGNYYATLRASYSYTKPPSLEGFFRVMGLRITPEVIWNAIPFTFVVDWVYKLNKFFEQFDKDPRIQVHIKDYCDTIKVSNVTLCERTLGATIAGYVPRYRDESAKDSTIWRRERSRYLRVPGSPNTGYALPVSDVLSGRELVLGGALLRTRIRG